MLIGHQKIWQFLTQSVAKNRLAHAYLFVGPPQIGKRTLALEFIKWLLCAKRGALAPCHDCRSCQEIAKGGYPDFMLVSPEVDEKQRSRAIGINQIRELQRRLSLSPYAADYKAALISNADAMSDEASNAFLKTLEEPSGQTLIILTITGEENVLPTIISRCQTIKFLPVPETKLARGLEDLYNKNDVKYVLPLTLGRPGRAIKILNNHSWRTDWEKDKSLFKKIIKSDLAEKFSLAEKLSCDGLNANDLLEKWQILSREELLRSVKEGQINRTMLFFIKNIQKTSQILKNPSFSARLALEDLMIKI
jgi:DNA polymerase-3 subunit delta'